MQPSRALLRAKNALSSHRVLQNYCVWLQHCGDLEPRTNVFVRGCKTETSSSSTSSPSQDDGAKASESRAGETDESKKQANWQSFLGSSRKSGEKFFKQGAERLSQFVNKKDGTSKSGKGKKEDANFNVFNMTKTFGNLMAEELKDMFDMKEHSVSTTKRRAETKGQEVEYSGPSDVTLAAEPEKSAWTKRWEELKDQAKSHAIFKKVAGLKEHKFVQKASDIAEDIRDRWETSDSPLVHRIQDNFQETDYAVAIKEIRNRDPNFDMVEFLRDVKGDILLVMQAFMDGNVEVLKEHCSKEICERVGAMSKESKRLGEVMDCQILDLKEVQLFDVKTFEDSPLIIIRFAIQQINVVRDRYGNILSGAVDEIVAMEYLWALQQDAHGTYQDGKYLNPRWLLREIQCIQEMKQIV